MDRRQVLAAGLLAAASRGASAAIQSGSRAPAKDGRLLRQSVARWCHSSLSIENLIELVKTTRLDGIDLLDPPDIEKVRAAKLACPVANGPTTISDGLNRLENHDAILKRAEELFPKISEAGAPLVIVFAGDRRGLGDDTGLENCAAGLKRLLPLAQKCNLGVAMEMLNSRVDHKDHMGDHTEWGVRLCESVGDKRFGLLYDIYHMQIMEGDVIRTIQKASPWILHYHTAGVPGRGPLDAQQELNYQAIMRAIVATGYHGFIGHEFMPAKDTKAELRAAIAACAGD
ncbi:MAG: TIM barrel protein [Planctomycetes bacterium]|nr:TIM barrel protein [Planctomycetota bacterium]